MRIPFRQLLILSVALLVGLLAGCSTQPAPVPPVQYTEPELRYILFSEFGEVFWCDSDFYPIGRPGQEEANAIDQFSAIKANSAEFAAILKHLGLPNQAQYTDEEKLQIYREHKKLKYAVQMTATGAVYHFIVRLGGEGQGQRIEGTISPSGVIKVSKREPSINTCPICLIAGTLIDTPEGQVPVQHLRNGMTVWTADGLGRRVTADLIKTASTEASSPFLVVKVSLDDGRTVTASPGHPTAEGKPLGDYPPGDTLDGAHVATVEKVFYSGTMTYDFLPSGATGLYWANHILLKSTLVTN